MGMRSLEFDTPKHVVKNVFYEIPICMRVYVRVCICVCVFMGGRGGVGILIVLLSAS